VADVLNNRIRMVTPDGQVSTWAGDGTKTYKEGKGLAGIKEGVGTGSEFNYPSGIALDGLGNIYIVDAGNYRIRKLVFYSRRPDSGARSWCGPYTKCNKTGRFACND
jgi:hypothetical protein